MDPEKNWEILFEILYKIVPPIILVLSLVFIWFFYDEKILIEIIKFLTPIAIFMFGFYLSFLYRKKKNKIIKKENGSNEVTITLRYTKLLIHEALIFLTPSIIIISSFWMRKEISIIDIVNAIIAFIGLYCSKLIYKRITY